MKKIILSLLLICLVASGVFAQRKIKDGTVTGSSDLPAPNAVVELESNNKGLLLPRLTTVQRDAISSPENGLMVYNTTTHCIDYYTGSSWVSTCSRVTGTAVITSIDCKSGTGWNKLGLSSGIRTAESKQVISVTVSTPGFYMLFTDAQNGIVFSAVAEFATAGTSDVTLLAYGTPVAAGPTTFNVDNKCSFTVDVDPTVYAICDAAHPTPVVEITTATGRVWMDRNLGAARAGVAANDYLARGCLFEWGTIYNGQPNTLNSATQSEVLYQGPTPSINSTSWSVGGANNPCPAGFRVPTVAEWQAEITANNITNNYSAYNILKLVATKYHTYWFPIDRNTPIISNWTSEVSPSFPAQAYAASFGESAGINAPKKVDPVPVRCIKN